MPNKKLKPLISLAPEVRQRIEDMQVDIESAEHNIGLMKELGFETKDIQDKLTWAKKAREILLREF